MYKIPSSLPQDIERFKTLATGYLQQKVSPTEFKAFRVPMGVYEQRKNEVYMARIRATGGVITPEQLIRVVEIGRKYGSDLLHFTTRGEVQILNLDIKQMDAVLSELMQAGLSTKGGGGNTVRNIIVSEWSGIGATEVFDTTPYAMALTDAVIPEKDSYLMPRKLKIAFASDDQFIDHAGINDIGLVAQIRDGRRGFRVYIGGGAGSRPTLGWLYKDFLPAEELYNLVKAVKTFFSEHGNRKEKYKARIRFIFYKYGAEETLRLIDEYYERQKAVGHLLETDIPAYEDEATVRPTIPYAPITLREDEQPNFEVWKQRYVTAQRQKGYASVLIPALWGNVRINDEKLHRGLIQLLNFVAQFGRHTLRITVKQHLRLRNIPESALPEIYRLLRSFDDSVALPPISNLITSCTGADTCRLGICLSKGLAATIREALLQSGLNLDLLRDARINVTGCPNLCAQPLWADLGFMGKVLHTDHAYPAYQIYIGASYAQDLRLAEAVGTVNAHDIPRWVVDLAKRFIDIADFAHKHNLALPYAGFGAFLRSEAGREAARELVVQYSTVPTFAADKNYYFDWGSDQVFDVARRGKPECSAGLFDMIAVDQKAIEEAQGKNIYTVIFHASRMLLVTRGLDPASPAEIFDAFVEHFITPGYIDRSFLPLILQAKTEGENGDYAAQSRQADALAAAVIALYQGMDDSLAFKKPEAASSSAKHGREVPNVKAEETKHECDVLNVKADVTKHACEDSHRGAESNEQRRATSSAVTEVKNTSEHKEAAPQVARTKDLRGVLCPMNFVRTKLELATLQSGDLLEILLDDGKPIENVPGSVRLEGHTVLHETQQSDGHWSVLIRKK